MGRRLHQTGAVLLLFLTSSVVYSADQVSAKAAPCEPWAAKIASVQGQVEARRSTQNEWQVVSLNAIYCPGDQIRVGDNGRAAIVLNNETLVRLNQNSAITLAEIKTDGPSLLELLKGIAHFISRVPRSLKVNTPFVNAAIEGTEFVVAIGDRQTEVTVFEGIVLTQNQYGELRITQNETALARAGSAPQKVLKATPRDAVQWALYFPPVFEQATGNLAIAQQQLYTGQIDDARNTLKHDSSAEALSLLAIIAVVQNDVNGALSTAQQAIAKNPQLAAAYIALSYAQQANRDLTAALTTAKQAAALESNNAIAWARVAELQLSTGDLSDALNAAQRATQINPKLARTQTILGFAYLLQIDIDEAKAAFDKAIELDQVDPLPRLGLGLAKIRKNELADGRRDIEIAASLDPNNAIIRSYLGKAYFEEKRAPLDAEQFAMAKELDPNDPTPWFYDAIRKQTENDPVGALEDLNTSIELNNNRAVYRSSLQLDQDEAARQASVATIYRDLNFDELAQNEAYTSLNNDVTNASAHRFLAESLGNRNRHEIARASEALQYLLLTPVALNLVPPSMSETKSGTLPNTGPGQGSFNEYNSLFVRNNTGWNISAIAGNQQTAGDEVAVATLYDNTVMGFGQYHYQTEGFRPNNDFQQDIFNLFLHSAITPSQDLQFEIKINDKEFGDRRLNFDPTVFSANRREIREEDSYRLGYHAKLTPNSRFLASLIYQDTVFSRSQSEQASPVGPFGPVIATTDLNSDFNTHNAEFQYILKKNIYQVLLGIGNYNEDQDRNNSVIFTSGGIQIGGGPPTIDNPKLTHNNSYIYNYLNLNNINLTIGASHDDYDQQIIKIDQYNGKFGFEWDITNGIRFRTTAFRTLKRSLTTNQTIEPTQIAGFNQFYDDISGADATNYGLGIDAKISQHLFTGIEFIHRYLDIPIISGSNVRIEEQNEYHDRLYLSWLISRSLSLTTRFEFEEHKRLLQSTSSINIPSEVITKSLPLSVTYYGDHQFFTALTATYVDQKITQPTSITPVLVLSHNQDNFWIWDYEMGYRLPKRAGNVSLVVKNLTDNQFNYQDTNFRTGLEQDPRFSHRRTYLVKINLNFD